MKIYLPECTVVLKHLADALHTPSVTSILAAYLQELLLLMSSAFKLQVPRLDLSRVLFPHSTRESQLQGFGQQLADDGDIWHTLEQPTVGVAPKATCNAFDLCIEVCLYTVMGSRQPAMCCLYHLY